MGALVFKAIAKSGKDKLPNLGVPLCETQATGLLEQQPKSMSAWMDGKKAVLFVNVATN